MDNTEQAAVQTPPMTPDQAYVRVVMRQRDEALNRAAELEVRLAMAMQTGADAAADNERLKSELAAAHGALAATPKKAPRR